jgi:uncharacterized membrane protein YphA (DoxX/SURF4 family)
MLRVYAGALFVDVFYYKIILGRMQRHDMSLREALAHFSETDYTTLLQRAIDDPPTVGLWGDGWRMDWYATFLQNVMLPGQMPYIAGACIICFELLLGIALILGIGVRLMGFLGALLILFFGLAKGSYFLTIMHGRQAEVLGPGPNWLILFVLLCLSLTAAGRVWGLDSRLRHRLPGWIS